MDKKVIEYNIPIQSEEQVDSYNMTAKILFGDSTIPKKCTDEHIDILLDKLLDAIEKVGDKGGWYCGDDIKVKIELEYKPQDK